jgi:Cu(I)/Ag(I) efflux system membrane fusion protein
MSRAAWLVGGLAALAAGVGGIWAISGSGVDLGNLDMARLLAAMPTQQARSARETAVPSATAAPAGPVIYYRDPDGQPRYSLEPKHTQDGRDYRPVLANEDASFDDLSPPKPAQSGTAATNRRILYYRNPMGLPDTSPVPKKDSMGMDYIPVMEGEDDGGPTVMVSAAKLQRTGVRSEPVERRVVKRALVAPGSVQLDERRIAVVALRSDSFIEKVENITTGDRVRKGQTLLQLYSPDIAAAGALYVSSVGIEGARRRLENLAVPPEVIAEIERTRRVPLTMAWPAPRDGVVLERSAIDGMRAAAGDVLFRIGDISTVWVLADVAERDLGLLRIGQAASVTLRSLPGRSFSGKVTLIYPQVAKQTRTVRVRIELANPDGLLIPDMYAEVTFATGPDKAVIAVADSAVIDTGVRQLVILDKGEGRFEPREVTTGFRGGGQTEIREGVSDGDRVVVAANFLIDAESNLKSALQGMAPP